MILKDLVKHLPFAQVNGDINFNIDSIDKDHREVKENSLFVCIKGYTEDGHNYAELAHQNGATAIIAERPLDINVPTIIVRDTKRALAILADQFYGRPTHQLQLIGVTGTNGKTTTTHLIEEIFREYGRNTGLIGTINSKINNNIYPVKNTTPDALFLQKMFYNMVIQGVQSVVMEVSSHALDMGRVYGCDFDIAVFTNLSQDHLDYHGTMDEYRRVKGLLFSQLGNKYEDKPKFAVLNNDDPVTSEYVRSTAAHIMTYGINKVSDVYAKNIQMSALGTTFDLITPIGDQHVKINLVGKFSIYNILAAVSTAITSQIPLDTIVHVIEKVKGVPGRFEIVDAGQDFSVIVDYAHTPDSLENALQTVQQFAKGKVTVVVGCGGDRDRTKRPIMAKAAVDHSDLAIFTSDNPRSENPEQIIQDMEDGVRDRDYKAIVDRSQAIHYALQLAKKDDVIVIAGKGHETYQQIGQNVFDFDDRLVARTWLKENVK